MGRYFYAVNVDTFEYVSPTRESSKLMGHSFQGNNFMLRVDKLLREDGKWYKCHLVWAGDSVKAEPGLVRPTEDGKGSQEVSLYNFVQYSSTGHPDGDRMMPCTDPASAQHGRYIVNHDMLEYADIEKLPTACDGSRVHPLPLLTSNGEEDYHGTDSDKVGRWTRSRISIQECPPDNPRFTELEVAFVDE